MWEAAMRLSACGVGVSILAMALMLAGCITKQGPDAPPPPEITDQTELFILMVETERWGVLLGRAREGVWQSPHSEGAPDESDMARADRAVKSGAAELILLRNAICSRGMLSASECELGDWPAWTLEPPRSDTPPSVIQQRSDWLSLTMERFVALGCEAGRKVTDDYQFCSVE
jgi:hypothetical protein